ncbi:transcriptional repressor [Candidatus Sumerlaeota bacterium]|nr:transcriptional repressor [Candidatus Sumerlaeota bacterium]
MTFEKVVERFSYFLKLRGLSLTRERRQILETIGDMQRPFSPDDLFFALHAAGKKTSKATIYRTIELLVECQIIRESDLPGRQATYELMQPGVHHGNMICDHCGRIVEFKGPTLERFIHEASVHHQFLPLTTSIKFTGICNECVKSNPPSLRSKVCVPFLKYAQSREN